MAKKKATSGVNRSQAIRDYLETDPGATPKTIVSALAAQGIEVSEGLASNVKYTTQAKQRGGWKRPGKRGRRRGAAAGSVSASDLFEAKRLVDVVGGIEEARKALDTLEQLL